MENKKTIKLQRDCSALLIPSAESIALTKGTEVIVQQALGGTYTVKTGSSLVRIDSRDADALGLIPLHTGTEVTAASECEDVPVDHDEIRRQLRTCFDPEIPVNILDLGLVYSCHISRHPEGGNHIQIEMTLTAPGCSMGAILASDVKAKLMQARGVRSVDIKLVFDPPWDSSRISEAAKLQLGLL
ncbi:putative Fe-S cluster assembly protein SufT [Amphritea sp. HPY]|uniref:putative Fe-S cluster assembly protein SufT n=1 Tax=Amphritea sp. HPY TaxID=3421652 RepID=UPI003D7CC814